MKKNKKQFFLKILYCSVILKNTKKLCSLNSVSFFAVFLNLNPQVHVTSTLWCSKKSAQLQWGKNEQKTYFMSQNEILCLQADFENTIFVRISFEEKTPLFSMCFWLISRANKYFLLRFLEGRKDLNFWNDHFPTKRSYSTKNVKLHENSFLSEVGGGVQMEKKTHFVSPLEILKPQIQNHEGM